MSLPTVEIGTLITRTPGIKGGTPHVAGTGVTVRTARHSLVRELRVRGADLSTPLEVGMVRKTDEEQLEWAALNRRTIYSFPERVGGDGKC